MKRLFLTILLNPLNLFVILKYWGRLLLNKNKTVVYNLHHDYFFDLFKDIYTALTNNGIDVYFSYNSENIGLKHYLKNCGLLSERIISNKISPFLPFDMFITAEVTGPDFPFRLLKTKTVQIYHGTGVYNLYEKKAVLSRFDVHFAVGPQFREFIENECLGKNSKTAVYDIGYPKTDRVFQTADIELAKKYNPENKKAILFAPHWNEFGALHKFGETIIEELAKFDAVIIIKPHNYLYKKFSGDNWENRFKTISQKYLNIQFATEADTQIFYPFSDIMVTDTGTTAAFEFSLFEKPLIVFRNDEWFYEREHVEVEKSIVETALTFGEISELTEVIKQTIAPEENMTTITKQQKLQKEMVQKFLYNPGKATGKAVEALLEELRTKQ